MPLADRAIVLYEEQYRYIDISGPGGLAAPNVCTGIGAAEFLLYMPCHIAVRTYFLGTHSIGGPPMLSPYRRIYNYSDNDPQHHCSFLYMYINTVCCVFNSAKDILNNIVHATPTTHDS